MRRSIKVGFGFGSTSGIITTLGLMVGLYAGTHSKLAILGAILAIAIADAFSDAFGIHVSEETGQKHKLKDVWEATVSTFAFKFLFAIIFIIPILLFSLQNAIIASIIGGLILLSIVNYVLDKRLKIVAEHIIIAIIVIIITYFVGNWIGLIFG